MTIEDESDNGPLGWAVAVDGVLSLRTASYKPEAAMINGLVLFGDLHPWGTVDWDDQRIRHEFEVRMAARSDKRFEVVPVECVERTL